MKYLKQYLNRYRAAKNRKDNLTHRLEEIRAEFGSPLKGIGFEQSAVSKTNKVGDGAAALTFRLAEIEDRIETERVIMQQRLAETMDIIELLPKDSIERDIVELKYIDGIVWPKVRERGVWLERTAYFGHLNRALNKLLEYEEVQRLIEKYEKENMI